MPRDERFDGDLPVEQQPEGPTQSPAEADEALKNAYEEAFAQAAQDNPELQNLFLEQPLQDEDQPSGRGFWRSLWNNIDSVFAVGGPAGIKLEEDVATALGRGATKFVDETAEFLTEDVGGAALANLTLGQLSGPGRLPEGPSLAEAVFTKEEEDFFFDWYDNRSRTETAVFGNDFRENHLKYENDTFAVHMIEGMTQFALGFAGLGKVRGLAGAATAAGRIGQGAVRGGIVDLAAFDPQEQRLSDLIESNPALSNPITRMLASDVEDSNMAGRIKNMFEGLVIGSTIDVFLEGVRAVRTWRAMKRGDLDPSEAIATITEQRRRAQEAFDAPPREDDVVAAVRREDGTFAVEAVERPEALPGEIRGEPVKIEEGEREFFRSGEVRPGEAVFGATELSETIVEQGGQAAERFALRVGDDEILRVQAELGVPPTSRVTESVRATKAALIKKAEAAGKKAVLIEGSSAAGGKGELILTPGALEEGRLRGPEGIVGGRRTVPESGVPAKSMEDAMMQAEAINWEARRARVASGAEGVEAQAKAWREATAKLEDATDVESIARLHEGTDIPLGYTSEPREIKAAVEAISDMIGPRLQETISHQSTRRLAEELFHGIPVDGVLDWAARTFGETSDLAARMVGMRLYLIGHVKTTRQLAKLLDHAPDNPILAQNLGRAMDAMYNLYRDVSGTSSNVGRALESQKVDVGSLQHMPPELKEAATVRDEFLSAKRAYDATLQSGDPEAIRAALQNLDDLGERMGAVAGGPRPKNKSGLSKIFDRDARRKAKAEQIEIDGLPTKPSIDDQLPAALKWYDDVAEQINKQVETSKAAQIEEIPFENPAPHKSFSRMSKEEIRQAARMVFMQDDIDVNAVMGLIMAPKRKVRPGAVGTKEAVIAFRINAMLSGPQTHLTNSLNNIAFMHLKGLEYWWSGVSPRARAKLRASGVTAREMRTAGSDLLMGYWLGMGEAWRAAKQSFKVRDNMLRPGTARDGLKSIGQVAPESSLWGGLWTIMNTPGRMLITADEFAQQMAYRSNVRMQLLRQARREAVSDVGQFVTDHMKYAFTDDGRGTVANAMRFSEEITFKTPTEPGTLTKTISEAAQKNAVVRFMFPFLRTPANLIKRGYQRTPLAAIWSREIAGEMAAGGERAAIATAQIELGSAMLAGASILAWNGMMSGRGPTDPDLRRQWRAQGNKPYSLRMPGTGVSISYRRGDPIMMFAAAIADITSAVGEFSDQQIDKSEIFGVLLSAATVSLGNKSYLQGATSVMEALAGGDPNKWERALTEAALSFSPALLRQLDFDNMEREVNGFVDRVMDGIPGFSQQLEPRRNLFGQKVLKSPGSDIQQFNPFTVSFMNEADREFNERIFEMGRAFSMPSKKMRVGSEEIDLTERGRWNGPDTPAAQRNQSPYDRYMELMGTVRMNGKTLEERLRELVASEEFAVAEKHGTVQEGGQAYIMVARELTTYQRLAYAQMIGEYPAIIDERARLLILGGGEKAGLRDIIEQAQ
jgi:hypothetical protein